jgi:hypothetical protein
MAHFPSVPRRLLAPSLGAAALLAALLPAAAAPTFAATSDCNGSLALVLDNPNAGDQLPVGKYQLQGEALDHAAGAGSSGVDSVNVYLDARDQGGIPLGPATLGQPGPAGFLATVDLSSFSGSHTLEVRAHSAVSGKEAVAWVPVTIGTSTSGGGVLGEPPLNSCAGQAAAAPIAAAAPSEAPAAVAPAIDQGRLGAGNVPSVPDQSIPGVLSTGSTNWGD